MSITCQTLHHDSGNELTSGEIPSVQSWEGSEQLPALGEGKTSILNLLS